MDSISGFPESDHLTLILEFQKLKKKWETISYPFKLAFLLREKTDGISGLPKSAPLDLYVFQNEKAGKTVSC